MDSNQDVASHLRKDLLANNRKILTLFKERSVLVGNVLQVKAKGPIEEFPFFDAKRELEVFADLAGILKTCGQKEWLSFSLMMEGHCRGESKKLVGQENFYPSWFFGDHLKSKHDPHLISRINPLLLYHVSPEHFFEINFNKKFADLILELI